MNVASPHSSMESECAWFLNHVSELPLTKPGGYFWHWSDQTITDDAVNDASLIATWKWVDSLWCKFYLGALTAMMTEIEAEEGESIVRCMCIMRLLPTHLLNPFLDHSDDSTRCRESVPLLPRRRELEQYQNSNTKPVGNREAAVDVSIELNPLRPLPSEYLPQPSTNGASSFWITTEYGNKTRNVIHSLQRLLHRKL